MAALRPGIVVAAIALGGALGPPAPASAQGAVQVPPIEAHTLLSKQVGDSFRIQVLLPPMLPGERTRFPVLYMTDINGEFMAAEALRMMMLGDVPRFIAVGIGYPGVTSLMQTLEIRARDLTPSVDTGAAGGGIGVPIAGALAPGRTSGGAPQFLEFIRQELIPFIDARYPTDPGDRGYWGDSLGGLFGCYILFTKPETFGRYIIGSPSLWWGNEAMLEVAKRFTETRHDLRARVFLGVGSLEESDPAGAPFRMVTNVHRLERLLRERGYPGLTLSTYLFPDESHTTVAMMNLIKGLVAVYGPPQESFMATAAARLAKPTERE
ncbi:MAG: alpha/beta hydrolase [Gemmatimonadales bacterium]